MKLYEAMFLVDSAKAAADWTGIEDAIKLVMQRGDAVLVSMKKWDERRLAYEVKGCSRGTYILCYFKADGSRIRDIERDVQLSEQFMRVLILSAEGRETDVGKETPTMKVEREIREKREAAEAKVAEAATAKAAKAAQAEQTAGEASSEVEAEVSESSQTPDVSETVEEPETGDAEVPAAAEPEQAEAAPMEAEVLQEQTKEEDKKPSAGEEVSP